MPNKLQKKTQVASGHVSPLFLFLNLGLCLFYFSWWLLYGDPGSLWLFAFLFAGEIYHVVMVLLFWFTVKGLQISPPKVVKKFRSDWKVDVYVTVAGEPIEIVRQTLQHILATHYHNKKIYLLNDSLVAGKENWYEYVQLARELGVECITRVKAGGAKAGNINHALRQTSAEFIAIFDADMAPVAHFFQEVMPYFANPNLAFVQTPQFYKNAKTNRITAAAWEQQEFFFGPIMQGKQASNAAFICGTNVVLRRSALEAVGGMNEKSIAEDFLTSLLIHQRGWQSLYHKQVLAFGLAPSDLLSYYRQQLRWARGSLEVLFRYNPLFISGLRWPQRFEYLSSVLYYCNGLIIAIDILIPLFFLFFGILPMQVATTTFALYFLPFMISILMSLHMVSGRALSFRAISFTQASFYLQLRAFWSALRKKNIAFAVTSKQQLEGDFIFLVYPHLAYMGIAFIAIVVGVEREGLTPSIFTNISWILLNSVLFFPFVWSATDWPKWLRRKVLNFFTLPVKAFSHDT